MRGHYDNYVSPRKPPPRKTPEACIRKAGMWTWCERSIGTMEFLFEDAERAVAVYADSDVIRACPGCVANVKAAHKASEGRMA